MTNRSAGRLAWSIALLSVALSGAGLVFTVKNGSSIVSYSGVFALVASVAFGLLGALLASRRPGNPIGWMFVSVAVVLSLNAVADGVANYGLTTNPGSVPGAAVGSWLKVWSWTPASGLLLVFVLLLFPDGRLPSRRWRPVAWVGAISIALASVPAAVAGWPLRGPKLLYSDEPPPSLPQAFRLAITIQEVAVVLIFLCGFLSAASLVVRLRRARGEGREQIRWFAFGGILMLIGLFASTPIVTGSTGFALIAVPMLPIAATVAILKYRLYDIDVVINKTVVYAVLAAFFTIVYVAIVVGIGTAIGSRSSRPLTIVAAVVMAVAFQPVRERARGFANRVVYGKRATPYQVLSEFAERMTATYSTDDVLPRMAQILAAGTGATDARVWLRVGDRLRMAASWPAEEGPPEELPVVGEELPAFSEGDQAFPVLDQGELLGALSVKMPPNEPLTPVQEKLIRDLASQAGLVLRNVRLIEELRASRQRLVAAQDQERRKLERNLHDGAQQQIVAVTLKQRLIENLVESNPAKAKEMLSQLQGETAEALETLRELARGIFPPLLADRGLPEALRSQARRSPIPVEVEADGVGRYSQELEAAVYFCCLEALQNVAKYAQASRATVRLFTEDGRLTFTVDDDGRGFDRGATSFGTGLQGMTDRLAAIGGTVEVRSEPGRGTTVVGRIPATS